MSSLLDFIAQFDIYDRFIDPVLGRIRHSRSHGLRGKRNKAAGVWRITIDRNAGRSGAEAERLLRKFGVPIYARWYDADCLYFNVKAVQARWAESVLRRNGFVIVSASYDAKAAKRDEQAKPPRAWADTPKKRRRA